MPKIFAVNWFRVDENGKFIWPGFADNVRVLRWIVDRCKGRGETVETPIGWVPGKHGINRDGLDVSDRTMEKLLTVNSEDWRKEIAESRTYFQTFGEKFPAELTKELDEIEKRLV
jgi:phosphoenolpyruvate carboxykinase (GTP)